MSILIDPTGRILDSEKEYKRVICLVPSITELICYLGAEESLAGVTSFCIHPDHIKKSVKVIGGTKTPRIDRILSLEPDLIIANKEENNKSDVGALEKMTDVYVSDVKDLEDNQRLILDIGELFNAADRAEQLVQSIEKNKAEYKPIAQDPVRAIYFIWKNPYMLAGGDTFIHAMMKEMGVINCIQEHSRYPVFSESGLASLDPEVVMLSSEPYPFKEKDIEELKGLWPEAKIILVDGELFSWYGSKIKDTHQYFAELWQRILV